MGQQQILWILFSVVVLGIIIVDLGLFQKKDRPPLLREAILKTVGYIVIALLFNTYLWHQEGGEKAMEFLSGYVIELSLSVDNLFIFMLVFSYFQIPEKRQNKILLYGILGAIIMRTIFIFAGVELFQHFEWVTYIFGAILLLTAVKVLMQKEEPANPEKSSIIKIIRKILPRADQFLVALLFIEISDLIFAFDSIPAVFSITKDPFIILTSNIFAILGLRSLYFCVSHAMVRMVYLRHTLGIILLFVGIKMLLSRHFEIPTPISLAVIVGLLIIGTLASLSKSKRGRL